MTAPRSCIASIASHVFDDRRIRAANVFRGIGTAERGRRIQREVLRNVSIECVVRARLIGEDVGCDSTPNQLWQDVGRVADESDRERALGARRFADPGERLVEAPRLAIAVSRLDALVDARLVDVDSEDRRVVHRRGERLRAAHAAKSGGEHEPAGERSAELRARDGAERLVRALEDSLRADVDPRAGGHLAVHHQTGALELAEIVPGRPTTNEIAVRDEHARRPRVRAEHADRLPALDEQRLVVLETPQRIDDRVERFPAARRAARAAIDDEIVGSLGDFRDRGCSSACAAPLPAAIPCTKARTRAGLGRLAARACAPVGSGDMRTLISCPSVKKPMRHRRLRPQYARCRATAPDRAPSGSTILRTAA